MRIELHGAAADKVERADVQAGMDGDPGAAFHQLFREERTRIAVVQRAVDMGGGDGDEARRTHQPGGLGDDSHRHRCPIAARAGGQRLLVRRQD